MNRPGQRGEKGNATAFPFLHSKQAQQFFAQQQERKRCADMTKDARNMVAGRPKRERGVIERVGQPLDRAVEIRGRRVRKKEMLKAFGNKPPTADERIAQNQGGVVPDKIISERRRVKSEDDDGKQKRGQNFFHG